MSSSSPATVTELDERVASHVNPFLIEALDNPHHRLMGLPDDDAAFAKLEEGDYGYVLDDVQHLTDYLFDLPTFPNPLQDHPTYSTVKQYFVNEDYTVPEKVVVQKNSPRGVHFCRPGPRQSVYFKPEDVKACTVTCGGLCPGLNTVIRELVCGLSHMYNVNDVFGIQNGYKGFYSCNYLPMTPKSVNDIHKRGGTVLGTSRGGHDTKKIVDNIRDRGINLVYIIGGDGTQKGAYEIFKTAASTSCGSGKKPIRKRGGRSCHQCKKVRKQPQELIKCERCSETIYCSPCIRKKYCPGRMTCHCL